jgi:hypothetical protein
MLDLEIRTAKQIAAEKDAAAAARVRAERNRRLAASDWTQVADAPVDRAAWAAYRQALRDITSHPQWPDMEWPWPPEPKPSARRDVS